MKPQRRSRESFDLQPAESLEMKPFDSFSKLGKFGIVRFLLVERQVTLVNARQPFDQDFLKPVW